MKLLTVILTAFAFAAQAAPTITYEGTTKTYNLRVGTTIVSRHASLAEAVTAAEARGAGTYTVTQPTATVSVAAAPPPPPPPAPEPEPAPTGALYLSPSGSDAGSCTQAAPCKTFARAWGLAVPGSTIIAGDGSYPDNPSPPAEKSGTAAQPITVRAANPGKAVLIGMLLKGNAYLTISGFRIAGTTGAVSVRSNGAGKPSHHLTFREIGFSCTPGTLNDGACFALSDGTHHVTLEDSWGWGGGRYTVLCYGGPGGSPPNVTCDYNIFRRLVLRMGPASSSSGNPQAALALYYAANNLVENVIALDGVPASNSSNSAFYITGHAAPPNSSGNRFYGVIAKNNLGAGFWLDCSGAICDGVQVRDSAFIGSAKSGMIVAGGSCVSAIIDRVTVYKAGGSGYVNYACVGATLTYSAFVGNAGYGAQQGTSGSTTAHHNGYFGNSAGARSSNIAAGAGDVTTDPGVVRITAQPYPGIGAAVTHRYQDGALTSTPLWPWQHEARIKAEMCKDTPTRGFCAASLTTYLRGG